MSIEKITYIGATDSRGKEQAFGIRPTDRAKHMYVIGKTGMGKSVLLENMAIQDIQNGEGLAFIDPHGSTAEKLLDYIPEHRIKDVVYFAPFDMDNPVAFNVMEDIGYEKRHLVVSGLMSAFKKIWVDAWSARMEYVLSNVLLALLEYPDSTLLDVNRMLSNKIFRNKVIKNITDPMVKSYWTEEYAGYTERFAAEMIPAIQNKVGQFTSNPLIRNILGQPKSSFDLREIMDNKRIFIANLSKGQMGETNADLIGSMLTTKIYLSAMSRADESSAVQAGLPPFYFYVDEFQSIANDSFADILSEARKYKLALIIAHQFIAQMGDNVRDAVFGNTGTIISFRVGPFDAEVLETIFKPKFFADDIVNLGKYQIYLTLMIDGAGSPPFSASTLPPIKEPEVSFREQILEMSRRNYGCPREKIEEAIKNRNQLDAPQQSVSKKTVDKSPKKNYQNQQHHTDQTKDYKDIKKKDTEHNNKKNEVYKKEKQTISLNSLKFRRQDNKGPSNAQKSLLREALQSVQNTKEDKKPKKIEPKKLRSVVPTNVKTPNTQTKLRTEPHSQSKAKEEKKEESSETPKEVSKEVLENILRDDK
ncbi:MAG TPA: hypothetical protein ENI63_00885 [Candidatus Kaiserbacteria bacterium]|nr:hypothetical protein [Candidatus Kaiserbacteria bacterium]